jgi:hypothetical protein
MIINWIRNPKKFRGFKIEPNGKEGEFDVYGELKVGIDKWVFVGRAKIPFIFLFSSTFPEILAGIYIPSLYFLIPSSLLLLSFLLWRYLK